MPGLVKALLKLATSAQNFGGPAALACPAHKIANVLDALPKRVQLRARRALHEIMEAESCADANAVLAAFRGEFVAKWSEAHEKLSRDREALVAFFDFPGEHCRHEPHPNLGVLVRGGETLHRRAEGRRLAPGGAGHGLEAPRLAVGALATGRRRRARRRGARRREVQHAIKLQEVDYGEEDERAVA